MAHELGAKSPLVSVFLPSYNQARYVREAIDSAINQDYPNLRVVIGDDGSTDGTAEIIREYAKRYPDRIAAILGEHVGITQNCNRLLRACTGKYIAFHAGDDVFLPGKIKRQVEWLEKDERRVICVHDVDLFDDETGRTIYISHGAAGRGAIPLVSKGPFFAAQSVMARTSALPVCGFDERLPTGSDWKLWIDCLASGGIFGNIKGVYSRYRKHAGSITKDDQTLSASITDCFVTLALVESEYPHLAPHCSTFRAQLFRSLGSSYADRGDLQSARYYLISARRQGLGALLANLPVTDRHPLLSRIFGKLFS